MQRRGFLIRFIDIGLIILFGFILISEIENLSQVELSAAAPSETPADSVQRMFVTVHIAPDGAFTVRDPADGSVRVQAVQDPQVLETALRDARAEARGAGRVLVVLIAPDEASVVQRTVDVMDVCDRLGLAKSLQTELTVGSGAP